MFGQLLDHLEHEDLRNGMSYIDLYSYHRFL